MSRFTMKPSSFPLDFEMANLKLSALQSAAAISKDVNGPTIGPNAIPDSPPRPSTDTNKELSQPPPPSPPVEIEDDPLWSSFQLAEESIIDLNSSVEVCNINSLTYKRTVAELHRLRKDIVRHELEKRAMERQRKMDAKLAEIERETVEIFAKRMAASVREMEERISTALEEMDLKEAQILDEERQRQELANQRLKEKSLQLKRQEERRRINARLDEIRKNQDRFKQIYAEYAELIRVTDRTLFEANAKSIDEKVNNLFAMNDQLLQSMRAGRISDNEVSASRNMCTDFEGIIKEIVDIIATAKSQAAAAAAAKAEPAAAPQTQVVSAPKAQTQSADSVDANRRGEQLLISAACLQRFIEINQFHDSYAGDLNSFVQDASVKRYRFGLTKSITIPVNGISVGRMEDLQDKFNKLSGLLRGQPVSQNNADIRATDHPLGVTYCTLLMAKQFVNKSSDISSGNNMKEAFPFAAIIVSLWHHFPDFGKLFLWHMYKDCPYLIPCYIPPTKGQPATEEYLQRIGYRFVDGKPEQPNEYLNRMKGMVRLFAAIMITRPRRNETNPFGLENGWRWLSNFLNLDPWAEISATMLVEFLTVAGSEMQRQFGKQFDKLMNMLRGPYLTRLRQKDEGGPCNRLELKLKERPFRAPEGVLPANFW